MLGLQFAPGAQEPGFRYLRIRFNCFLMLPSSSSPSLVLELRLSAITPAHILLLATGGARLCPEREGGTSTGDGCAGAQFPETAPKCRNQEESPRDCRDQEKPGGTIDGGTNALRCFLFRPGARSILPPSRPQGRSRLAVNGPSRGSEVEFVYIVYGHRFLLLPVCMTRKP